MPLSSRTVRLSGGSPKHWQGRQPKLCSATDQSQSHGGGQGKQREPRSERRAQPRPERRRARYAMAASARHSAAQPRPGRRRRGCSMTASACPQAAQPRQGRRRRGCSRSSRHPAAQPRQGRRRPGCSLTASARPSLPKQMTIPSAFSCTRLLTPSFSLYLFVISCSLGPQQVVSAPFFSNGQAHQRKACPSCDW